MNSNLDSLTALAQRVEEMENSKQDFVVPHEELAMSNDKELWVGKEIYNVTDHCHGQIAEKTGIPKKYYDKMEEVAGLRSYNVNSWLAQESKNKFVRTIDGKARAFLSDAYHPMDNYPILHATLPVIEEQGDVEVKSVNLSDTRMYLQCVFPNLQTDVTVGDPVQMGIIITNSEVGKGAVDIKQVIWRLICSNGMIGQSVFRKHHVGKRIDTENDYGIFANDTIEAEIESLKLRMRDVLKHALNIDTFNEQVELMREAKGDQITRVTKTVQNVTKRFNISESYQDSMIENIHAEHNPNRYGLANSITALAKSIGNPDDAYEVEKLGHKIITLSPSEWSTLNVA